MIATIVDILGMDHLGTYDASDQPMTDVFRKNAAPWNFHAIVPEILKTTQLPLPVEETKKTAAPRDAFAAAYSRPRHDAAYWAARTAGFDFSVEDRLDSAQYNRILWQGLVGENVAYPSVRDGRDLRHNRDTLLRRFHKARVELLSAPSPAAKPSTAAVALQEQTKD
jgi:hypothetical protein